MVDKSLIFDKLSSQANVKNITRRKVAPFENINKRNWNLVIIAIKCKNITVKTWLKFFYHHFFLLN